MGYKRFVGDMEADDLYDNVSRLWMSRFVRVTPQGFMVHHENGKKMMARTERDMLHNEHHAEAYEFFDKEFLDEFWDEIHKTAKSSTVIASFDDLKDWVEREDVMLYGHNFIQYDIPCFKKVLGFDYYGAPELSSDARPVADTLIMSRTQRCDRPAVKGAKGPHGLAAWGERKGFSKVEHEEWNKASMAMLKRLRDDVTINVMTLCDLYQERNIDKLSCGIDWNPALKEEHLASKVMARAERIGIPFDKPFAQGLFADLDKSVRDADAAIMPLLPARLIEYGSTKVSNADYVDKMHLLSDELIDLGLFRTEVVMDPKTNKPVMVESILPGGEVKTIHKVNKIAEWPLAWDFANDDIKHVAPVVKPFDPKTGKVAKVPSNYWARIAREDGLELTAIEALNLNFPILDPEDAELGMCDQRLMTAAYKVVGTTAAKFQGDDYQLYCDVYGDLHKGFRGEELPKWLQTSSYIGPCTYYRRQLCDYVIGPYSRVEHGPYNLDSNNQAKELLLQHFEWIPDEWTEKGSPKLTESSFDRSLTSPIGMMLKGRMVDVARRSMVKNPHDNTKGWLNKLREDGWITQYNNPQGANTTRSTHSGVVNVPAVKSPWGHESRRCFIAPLVSDVLAMPQGALCEPWSYDMVFKSKMARDKRIKLNESLAFGFEEWEHQEDTDSPEEFHLKTHVQGRLAMVGCDASGLEMRMLAHVMDDASITAEIIDGDFHTIVWKTFDEYVATRDDTKTFEYAMIYGGGDEKLGSIATLNRDKFDKDMFIKLGWMEDESGMWTYVTWREGRDKITFLQLQNRVIGAMLRSLVMEGLEPLGQAVEEVAQEAEQGWIESIDGRKLEVRGEHAALNLKLQSTGAIVMKRALVDVAQQLEQKRLEDPCFYGEIVIYYHDEINCICLPQYAEWIGEMIRQAIVDAGIYFDVKCPLDGEYLIGLSWLDIH